MEGVWPIIFLGLVLKIPVFFGLWLVWWAVRQEPELDDAPEPGDGARLPPLAPRAQAARAAPAAARTAAPPAPLPTARPRAASGSAARPAPVDRLAARARAPSAG